MTPLIVYTAVIGPMTDTLRPPQVPQTATCVCFTDDLSLKVDGWQIVHVPAEADPVRQARGIKILGQPGLYAYATLWMDAAYTLTVDAVELVGPQWMLTDDVLALPHPHRHCVAAEANELVKLGLATREDVNQQCERFDEAGFDPFIQRGLTSTGFLLRRTANTQHFNDVWWAQFGYAKHTRDQMSVDFAAWATETKIGYLPGHYRDNPYAHWAGRRR